MNYLNYILNKIVFFGVFLTTLTPLIVVDQLFFPFITGKVFLFRFLVEIIFAAWLVLIVREPNLRPRKGFILWSSIIWIVFATLATVFSLNPVASFWSNFERMEGLVTFLHIFAYFLVVTSIFRGKIWFWFFNTTLAVSLWISLLGILEYFGINQGDWRIDATLGNPTYLASYLMFHIFIAGILLNRHTDGLEKLKIIYGLAIIVELFVLFQTGTRGTILGFLGGLVLFFLIIALFGKDYKKGRGVAVAGLLSLILLSGSLFIARDAELVRSHPILARLTSISLEDHTTNSRFVIWGMALKGFRERPILGYGFENFSFVFDKYYNPKIYDQEQWFDRAHNVIFDWLIAGGIIGLIAYLLLFVSSVFVLIRSESFSFVEKSLWLSFLTSYFFHNLFVFDNIVSYFLFFSVLAYFHSENSGEKYFLGKIGNQSLQNVTIGIAVSILILSNIFFVFKPMASANDIIIGLRSLNRGLANNNEDDITQFVISLEKAYDGSLVAKREAAEQLILNIYPILVSPTISSEIKNNIAMRAVSLIEKEISRNPNSTRIWLFYANFLHNFSEPDDPSASIAFSRALELSPTKPHILFQMAENAMKSGNNDKAIEYSTHAYELAKDFREAQIKHALILFRLNYIKEAEKILIENFSTLVVDDDQLLDYFVSVRRLNLVEDIWLKKVKSNPNILENWFSYTGSLLAQNKINRAIEVLEEAILHLPDQKEQIEQAIAAIKSGQAKVDF